MVDIFMESLLGALVQFGRAVTIDPGMGALAFCAVVIVTIFAAEAFDPRLMWDAAARNAHRPLALRWQQKTVSKVHPRTWAVRLILAADPFFAGLTWNDGKPDLSEHFPL